MKLKIAVGILTSAAIGSLAFADGATFSMADIKGVGDVATLDGFVKALTEIDPIRTVTRMTVSDKKPEFVRKEGNAVVIRYFYTLSYDMDAYGKTLLPKLEKVFAEVGKCESKTMTVKLQKDDFIVKLADLSQTGTFFADLHEITRKNPETKCACFYVNDMNLFGPPNFPYGEYDRKIGFPKCDYVDVVESIARTGIMKIKRYTLNKEQVDVFAKWRRDYMDRMAKFQYLVKLSDKEGEAVIENACPMKYPRMFNGDGVFCALAVKNMDEFTKYHNARRGPYPIIFSPFFGVQIKDALSPTVGLSSAMECFTDVSEKDDELKSIVKFEVDWIRK